MRLSEVLARCPAPEPAVRRGEVESGALVGLTSRGPDESDLKRCGAGRPTFRAAVLALAPSGLSSPCSNSWPCRVATPGSRSESGQP
jgi:hypothetical protein